MNITISGASGSISKHLTEYLMEGGHRIVPLGRSMFCKDTSGHLTQALSHCDVVTNLVGTSISKRWASEYKKEPYDNRIEVTHHIIRVMDAVKTKLRLMVSASAIEYYPEDGTFDEYTNTRGSDLLTELCYAWEKEAHRCPSQTRLTITRFGIVLSPDGGTMEQMLRPLRITQVAGVTAPDTQSFPWIGIQGLCRAMKFIINHEILNEVFNLVVPQQISQYTFTRTITTRYHTWVKVIMPRWFFRMQYGEAASFLTSGQNVRPTRLLEAGFRFSKPTVEAFFGGTDHNTVDELDLQRYVGTWYEVARFDHHFKQGLSEVTTAYTLLPGGTVYVENRGCKHRKPYGVCKAAEGRIKVPGSSRPGKLKVSFFLSFHPDYYVLELDQEGYNYILIDSSSDRYLWILSRTPILPEEIKKKLLDAAIRRGYDVNKLIWVEQREKSLK